jgi:rSAM/selenodomain-associated transferase 2/rSAM/selenodomain-associated transferase 1
MTAHTLAWAAALAPAIDVEVSLAGGTVSEFESIFPSLPKTSTRVTVQVGSDLGDRMHRAFLSAHHAGHHQTVIVGTDAPELDAAIARQAFDSLGRCDLVLGPAWDGGYYLIGLRQPIPDLFHQMPWGTEHVLDETLRRAKDLRLSVALLQPLADIDRPEDLPLWTKTVRQPVGPLDRDIVSVIIPTRQEENRIAKTVERLLALPDVEVIVVDGESTDQTIPRASQAGAQTFSSPDGRGSQLNLGASIARGQSLLFLHADTQLPSDFPRRVKRHLEQHDISAGAFSFEVDEPAAVPWLIRWGANVRSRWFSLPFGDQAIFTRASTFWKQAGFRSWPILEDVALVRDLAREGRITIDPAPAITSARRWKAVGPWRTWRINQLVLLGYLFGCPPERLAHYYRKSLGTPLKD